MVDIDDKTQLLVTVADNRSESKLKLMKGIPMRNDGEGCFGADRQRQGMLQESC